MYGGDDDIFTSNIAYLLGQYGESFPRAATPEERERFHELFQSRRDRNIFSLSSQRKNTQDTLISSILLSGVILGMEFVPALG